MKCPYCGKIEDKVIDSRSNQEADTIRRRRECLLCGRRFTTYEHIENIPLIVVKKDNRREPFDRMKVLNGMMKACGKRPVSLETLESAADDIERRIEKNSANEVSSKDIGELVMAKLHDVDGVAYVRFASVYREFKDASEFMKEVAAFTKGSKTREEGNEADGKGHVFQ